MPSRLRLSSSFEPISAKATYQTSPTLPPTKKQKMSLTQTYRVASTARSKLGREASRADHNLRLLVGHANLLDTLMIDLADAEREQEAWFHQSVKKAGKPEEPRHITWIDSIAEEEEEDEASDSDVESEMDDEEEEDDETALFNLPLRKIRSPPMDLSSAEIDSDDDDDDDDEEMEDVEYDDEEDDEAHALTRTISQHSPPELTLDSDSDSEDELMPASPEQQSFALSEKERATITTTNFYDAKLSLEDYLAKQQQERQPLIAAC